MIESMSIEYSAVCAVRSINSSTSRRHHHCGSENIHTHLRNRLRPAVQCPRTFTRLLPALQVPARTQRTSEGRDTSESVDVIATVTERLGTTHGYCHIWCTWCKRPTCENHAPTGATNFRRASIPLRLPSKYQSCSTPHVRTIKLTMYAPTATAHLGAADTCAVRKSRLLCEEEPSGRTQTPGRAAATANQGTATTCCKFGCASARWRQSGSNGRRPVGKTVRTGEFLIFWVVLS